MPNLKSLKRRVWASWDVLGAQNVAELEKGLWMFEFESQKEAKRILRRGSRRFGDFGLSLKKWSQDFVCSSVGNVEKEAWVKLVGLSVLLWSQYILKRIRDGCKGFLAMDEDTAFLFELRWARIRVKCDGSTLPKVTVVTVGDQSFEIQLWWEIQPRFVDARLERPPEKVGSPWEKTKFSHMLKRV